MTTALDIINGALRLLQVKSSDAALTAEEANDALDSLNTMIDGWSTGSLMVYHATKESFMLTPGQSTYTIGTGGNFNTSRPVDILQATLTVNGSDYGVTPVGFDDYADIRLKTLSTTFVEQLYYEKSFPLGNIYLYPVPNSASTLTIYSNKQLTEFTSLTDTFVFPNGYKKAMKYALAMDLAPEYQRDAGDDVRRTAVSAVAAIKRMNRRPVTMQPDSAVMIGSKRNRFNIYKGA